MSKKDSSNLSSWSILKKIARYAKPYKLWGFLSCITAFISAMCNISQVYVINEMVNGSIEGEINKLFILIFIILIITIIWVASKYTMKYASGYYSTYMIVDLKKSFTNHVQAISVCDIEKKHTGDIISRFTNDLQTVERFLSKDFINIMYMPFIFIGSLTFMLAINVKLVIVCFCVTPAAVYLSNKMSKPIKKRSKEYHAQLGSTNNIVHDITGGISIIKAFNLQDQLFRKYKNSLSIVLKNAIDIEKIRACMRPVMVMTYELPYMICLIYGGIISMRGEISPGSLISYTFLLKYIINPISTLPQLIANLKNLIGAGERISEIMEIPLERVDGTNVDKTGNNAIEFKNVTFKYENSKAVLDNLSFTLEKGKTIAIIGPSGGGKSTIVSLLCGFYELNNGQICYFGKDMHTLNLKEIRKKVSLVSQDTYLFPDSIEANIKYGNESATREEVIEAAKAANAHDFILEMSNGYDTLVGERGVKLSGGQKQRIAIARAMLKNADVLLLDEPTSALDNFSEAQVQEALENITKEHTVLIIAHRLSTIKNADMVLVLDEGHVVEKGTHEELIEKGGLYKQLYLKQFSFNSENNDSLVKDKEEEIS